MLKTKLTKKMNFLSREFSYSIHLKYDQSLNEMDVWFSDGL